MTLFLVHILSDAIWSRMLVDEHMKTVGFLSCVQLWCEVGRRMWQPQTISSRKNHTACIRHAAWVRLVGPKVWPIHRMTKDHVITQLDGLV